MIRGRQKSSHVDRRQLLRAGFLGGVVLAGTELLASIAPFMTVNRIVGLGLPVNVGTKVAILALFADTNDAPILFRAGHFFLLHPKGGIVAAYRKCTHLGCAVPWVASEDRFHCPCHQSQYDKHTAVVTYRRAGRGHEPAQRHRPPFQPVGPVRDRGGGLAEGDRGQPEGGGR